MVRSILPVLITSVGLLLAACSSRRAEPPPPLLNRLATTRPFAELPVAQVTVDAQADVGAFEPWRHTVGHGGVNYLPLPDRVVEGTAQLKPRRVRIFIQEFFNVYPEHGRFDWSRLDPYMDALHRTGANVVAAITIKPKPLYPTIDAKVWRPSSVEEWQRVVHEMVRRYSVERKIVTHWEIGNETDIGEWGGCPFLIPDAKDYTEYYRMTIQPILAAFPRAKVGGAAVANAGGELLPAFIQRCRDERLPLDFISWHLYSDDPQHHAGLIRKYARLLEDWPGQRPEMFVTEWSKSFDPVSLEELAFEPRRAAIVAATIQAMMDAGDAWSFYYHLWDQVCYIDSFKPFFADPNIMYHHWNQVPHRFALFGEGGEVRPQYFVYQMLGRMGDRRIKAQSSEPDLRALAARNGDNVSLCLTNLGQPRSQDRVATVRFDHVKPGRKMLRTWRIDRACNWSDRDLALHTLEQREVDVRADFMCQVYCPGDSVLFVSLEETTRDRTAASDRKTS